MSYNKEKALQILKNILQEETNENIRDAISDLEYALSLALVAYKNHLENWIRCDCLTGDDYEYCEALKRIDKELVRHNIFMEYLDAK